MAFVKSETTQDYRTAIDVITAAGYTIKGIIIDGKKALFKEFQDHPRSDVPIPYVTDS